LATVTVVRYGTWDGNDNVPSPYYATRATIERFKGQGTGAYEIEGTDIQVDEPELDGKGCWRPSALVWRVTADDPPTENDAVNGLVCVYFADQKLEETARWSDVAAKPADYPLWQRYPLV
jgi:hypothetical protein